MRKYFSSESVTEGHPDKVADYIADSILDEALKQDPNSRVACEISVTTNFCLIYGEITTKAILDFDKIARKAIKETGFDNDEYGFNAEKIEILIKLDPQSPDIAMGIDKEVQGAGDQGIMFGYASNETPEYMPLAIALANRIAARLAFVRKNNIIKGLRPDGKCQVTIAYDENNIPQEIDTIVLSTQHDEDKSIDELKIDLKKHVFDVVLPKELVSKNTKYLINPTGRFVIGGPAGDSGLTGRKIIVDTYGGYARNGGGAFSGKDPSKVDRTASYMLRYIAKNIVASGVAKRCELQVAYAIGVAEPVSIYVETFGTSLVLEEKIVNVIKENFDLTPAGMIKTLDLKKPFYKQTTVYGHFGKENLSYERLDKVEIFKSLLK